jgi:hypothetical protein
MQALSEATLAVQAGASFTPLVHVDIGGSGFSTSDPSSGLLFVETVEEGESFRATIEIKPSVLQATHPGILEQLEGESVTISWGFLNPATGWASEMIEAPPLKVVSTSGRSEPGNVAARFECVGWWELLAGTRVVRDPSDADAAPPVWPGDTTVRGILNELLQGKAPVFLDSSDGVVDVYRPYYEADGLESVMTTVRNLLDMTSCYISLRSDGFHIVFPSADGPLDYTYNLDDHRFFVRAHAAKATIPNRIVMVPQLPSVDEAPEFIGVAQDQDSIDKLGYLDLITTDEGVLSQGEANNRAYRLLQRLKAESSEGIATVPMNIGQELYDRVRVIDARIGGVPIDSFVGMIRRVWTSGQYTMEIGLGGLMPHLSGLRTSYPSDPIVTSPIVGPAPSPHEPPTFNLQPPTIGPIPPVFGLEPPTVRSSRPPVVPELPALWGTGPTSEVRGSSMAPPPPAVTPSPPSPTDRNLAALQERVSDIFNQVVSIELTVGQRMFAGKLPEPEAVPSIASGVAGRSNFPIAGPGGTTIHNVSQFLTGGRMGRWSAISLQANPREVPAAVRHETAHHILGARGIPRSEHEPILRVARVPGTTRGVHFGILAMAVRAYQDPSEERINRFQMTRWRMAFDLQRRSRR